METSQNAMETGIVRVCMWILISFSHVIGGLTVQGHPGVAQGYPKFCNQEPGPVWITTCFRCTQ